jgi:hypothetical protein
LAVVEAEPAPEAVSNVVPTSPSPLAEAEASDGSTTSSSVPSADAVAATNLEEAVCNGAVPSTPTPSAATVTLLAPGAVCIVTALTSPPQSIVEETCVGTSSSLSSAAALTATAPEAVYIGDAPLTPTLSNEQKAGVGPSPFVSLVAPVASTLSDASCNGVALTNPPPLAAALNEGEFLDDVYYGDQQFPVVPSLSPTSKPADAEPSSVSGTALVNLPLPPVLGLESAGAAQATANAFFSSFSSSVPEESLLEPIEKPKPFLHPIVVNDKRVTSGVLFYQICTGRRKRWVQYGGSKSKPLSEKLQQAINAYEDRQVSTDQPPSSIAAIDSESQISPAQPASIPDINMVVSSEEIETSSDAGSALDPSELKVNRKRRRSKRVEKQPLFMRRAVATPSDGELADNKRISTRKRKAVSEKQSTRPSKIPKTISYSALDYSRDDESGILIILCI